MSTESFVITTDPDNIPLILLPEVELVVWRHTPAIGLDGSLGNFDIKAFKMDKVGNKKRGEDYIDADRFFISEEEDKDDYPTLESAWQDRNALRATFSKALRTDIDMTHLFVQAAIRPDQRDNTFHKDYSTGYDSEAARRRDEAVFMTVVHKGYGTETLPAKDAGRPTPYTKDNRASFYHPRDLSRLFCGQTHDVMVMKAGRNGTVHRSPHQGEGWRWWTFYKAESTIQDNRRAFGRDGLRDLQARYEALKAS